MQKCAHRSLQALQFWWRSWWHQLCSVVLHPELSPLASLEPFKIFCNLLFKNFSYYAMCLTPIFSLATFSIKDIILSSSSLVLHDILTDGCNVSGGISRSLVHNITQLPKIGLKQIKPTKPRQWEDDIDKVATNISFKDHTKN